MLYYNRGEDGFICFLVFETQVQGLVTEDQSQPSRRPETGAESATHEDTGTCQQRGEVSVCQPEDGEWGGLEDWGHRCNLIIGLEFYIMLQCIISYTTWLYLYQATSDCSRTWVQSPLQGFFVLDIAINITQWCDNSIPLPMVTWCHTEPGCSCPLSPVPRSN